MANRADDLLAILQDATYGWSNANCTTPVFVLAEDIEKPDLEYRMSKNVRTVYVKMQQPQPLEMHTLHTGNKVYDFPAILIGSTQDDLEDMFDEANRVMVVYSQSPWAENGHTYDLAQIVQVENSSRNPRFDAVMDVVFQLAYIVTNL